MLLGDGRGVATLLLARLQQAGASVQALSGSSADVARVAEFAPRTIIDLRQLDDPTVTAAAASAAEIRTPVERALALVQSGFAGVTPAGYVVVHCGSVGEGLAGFAKALARANLCQLMI